MFQWLTGVGARERVRFFESGSQSVFLQPVMVLLIFFCSPVTAFAGTPPPSWSVPLHISSDDGYAELNWIQEQTDSGRLFRITETFNGKESSQYTENTNLLSWRVSPGEYKYVLQSCLKHIEDMPECGEPSETLTLVVNKSVTSTLLTEDRIATTENTKSEGTNGGPDQFQPGHWYNPAKDGHGWNFYWANRLALDGDHDLFGNSYDLVGVWYTYEAKSAASVPGCAACPPETSVYRPVVLKLRAVSTGVDSYEGGLYLSRDNGSEIWVGSGEVVFGSNSSSATVTWSANFKKESLAGSDPLVFLLGSDPADINNISHFSGLWEAIGDDSFMAITSIGDLAEVMTIVFHDDAGDPTWIQALEYGPAVAQSSSFCLAYQRAGYSPQTETPQGWLQDWYHSPSLQVVRFILGQATQRYRWKKQPVFMA
jgi:hypothetical protein